MCKQTLSYSISLFRIHLYTDALRNGVVDVVVGDSADGLCRLYKTRSMQIRFV